MYFPEKYLKTKIYFLLLIFKSGFKKFDDYFLNEKGII